MLHNFYYANTVINSHTQTSAAQLAQASSCPFHVQHTVRKPSSSHPMPKLQMICANEFHHTNTTAYFLERASRSALMK